MIHLPPDVIHSLLAGVLFVLLLDRWVQGRRCDRLEQAVRAHGLTWGEPLSAWQRVRGWVAAVRDWLARDDEPVVVEPVEDEWRKGFLFRPDVTEQSR